jgi:hypothetical protein
MKSEAPVVGGILAAGPWTTKTGHKRLRAGHISMPSYANDFFRHFDMARLHMLLVHA